MDKIQAQLDKIYESQSEVQKKSDELISYRHKIRESLEQVRMKQVQSKDLIQRAKIHVDEQIHARQQYEHEQQLRNMGQEKQLQHERLMRQKQEQEEMMKVLQASCPAQTVRTYACNQDGYRLVKTISYVADPRT